MEHIIINHIQIDGIGLGISCGSDTRIHSALCHAAAESYLYRYYKSKERSGVSRTEEGYTDSCA